MADQVFDGIISEGRGGGAWVAVPFDVEQIFGTRGQVRIVATFDGVEDQTSLAPMGGQHVLGLRKSVRGILKKGVGDTVQVTLRRNDAPRTFEMPPELTEALARDPDASDFFDGRSFTHRKEMANGIREAKKRRDQAAEARQGDDVAPGPPKAELTATPPIEASPSPSSMLLVSVAPRRGQLQDACPFDQP